MSSASERGRRFGNLWLTGGYAFLYLPIVTLVVFSFNASKMASVWGGFSTHWYAELANDTELIGGFWLSLRIALMTATASILLGTLAAFALVKYRRFPGRTAFSGMLSAPLVMPEVIVGLSLLLMLVSAQRAFGWPERGMLTIWFGHTLLGMAYATVVMQSRLLELDKSLEEAAMDLGCRPYQVFGLITLPAIAQSLLSAWLLTFTISLDDVVISAFLSGPGATTLPIVIFSRARLGLNPTVNAVATLMVAVVSVGVIAGSLWLARQEKKRAAEQAAAYRNAG
ncbi:ABC transporter permease subunit [Derxia lacustris]|uniref:ABC transporter permease subunit n=1 Tax=Derxia lacustris TaxID=764842 RepID=UPI000A171EBC|nr:ABC transporter permease subunit [Derxia lacustris]